MWQAFDNLLLLQRGGRTTFFGPLGQESHKLVAYLEAVPGVWGAALTLVWEMGKRRSSGPWVRI